MSPKAPAQPMAQPEHALFEPATQPLKQTSAQNTRTNSASAEDAQERARKEQALERFIAHEAQELATMWSQAPWGDHPDWAQLEAEFAEDAAAPPHGLFTLRLERTAAVPAEFTLPDNARCSQLFAVVKAQEYWDDDAKASLCYDRWGRKFLCMQNNSGQCYPDPTLRAVLYPGMQLTLVIDDFDTSYSYHVLVDWRSGS